MIAAQRWIVRQTWSRLGAGLAVVAALTGLLATPAATAAPPPAGATITEFPVPTGGALAAVDVIVAGPDGALWFTGGPIDQIGRITTSGAVTEFPLPTAGANAIGIT